MDVEVRLGPSFPVHSHAWPILTKPVHPAAPVSGIDQVGHWYDAAPVSEGYDQGGDCPSAKTIAKALARLSQKGLELFWVREEARVLFRLECVRRRAEEFDGQEDALSLALIAILRELVETIKETQHGKILWTVLDFDGDNRETSAKHRRTIAGQQFRDGAHPVTYGTIRKHHEPKAHQRLAALLLGVEAKTRVS